MISIIESSFVWDLPKKQHLTLKRLSGHLSKNRCRLCGDLCFVPSGFASVLFKLDHSRSKGTCVTWDATENLRVCWCKSILFAFDFLAFRMFLDIGSSNRCLVIMFYNWMVSLDH